MNGVYKNIAGMAVCLLLCACAERESLLPDGLIRLGTRADKSTDVRTRASVNDLAGLVAVGDRVGVYGVVTDRADASYAALTAEWDTAPLMNNVRTTKIDATSGMLFWDGDYSYPPEENKRVKFCVYHPYAPVGTGGDNYVEAVAGHSPVLHFKLTGAEDVMWAHPVTGSRRQVPSALILEHKLTQLRFRLIDDEGEFAGVKVTGLLLTTLDLETGEPGGWSVASDAVRFPLKASVAITGTTDAPQILAGEVMLQPEQSVFRLTLKTDGRGDCSGIEIRPSGGETVFRAGRSYMVTLKFRDHTAVALSAKVTPWVMDGYGEGMVE